jgi:hypothetical protein
VTASPEAFLEGGEELFARAPVTTLHLRVGAKGISELAGSPLLARLRGLVVLGEKLGTRGLDTLLRSAYLGRLRYLSLRGQRLGDWGARLLARAGGLLALEELRRTGG